MERRKKTSLELVRVELDGPVRFVECPVRRFTVRELLRELGFRLLEIVKGYSLAAKEKVWSPRPLTKRSRTSWLLDSLPVSARTVKRL